MERLKNRTTLIRVVLIAALVIIGAWAVWPTNFSIHLPGLPVSDDVPVLVADHYLTAFAAIKPDSVRVENYPKAFVPPGALHNKEELQNQSTQMLFSAAVAIPEGQPITRTLVISPEQSASLTTQIRPGKVAVSFQLDMAHGVGGWIKPGDTIALFRTLPLSPNAGRSPSRITQLLLPAIPVLAVDTDRLASLPPKIGSDHSESDNETPPVIPVEAKVITVLVTPREASQIVEAREQGALSAALRATGDDYVWTPD
jgi:pilus assembly protein CpaB